MPFGSDCEFANFNECVAANQDKDDPDAYCATLMDETEDQCNKAGAAGEEYLGDDAMTEIDEGTVQLLRDAAPARLDVDVCRTTTPNISVRADDDGEGEETMPTMAGHFSTFNDWYEINSWFEGHFMERIESGAFKRTFNAAKSAKDKHRIQVLLEHGFDPTVGDKPLGAADVLEEDSEGARFEVPLFDTSYTRDLVPALKSGVYGSSFRFQVMRDEWVDEPDPSDSNPRALPERTIKEVRVAEFGPTVFPANPNATADVRSLTDAYYEKLRAKRQFTEYQEAVERAAHARGVGVVEKETTSDDHDNPVTEDSHSEHSEDSRKDDSAESPPHSTDSQDESTPAAEGESETRKQTCAHAFCERKRTGENSERECFFNKS